MSHYEINVAKNGMHLFATHERSLTSEQKALEAFMELRTRFPSGEGFSVSMTYMERIGRPVDVELMLKRREEALR